MSKIFLALFFILLSHSGHKFINASPSNNDDDKVRVSIDGDDFEGSVYVPRWVLGQIGASVGIVPPGSSGSGSDVSYENDLPSSIKMERDWYEILIDLNNYDEEHIKIRVVDSQTIQVEARQRYTHHNNGNAIGRTIVKKFIVPKTYNIKNSVAKINHNGMMTIMVPNAHNDLIRVVNCDDKYVNIRNN